MKVIQSVLGTAYRSLMETKGTKLVLALTCGQTFSRSEAFEDWKEIAASG